MDYIINYDKWISLFEKKTVYPHNGNLPDNLLFPINVEEGDGKGHKLNKMAANAYNAMKEAAKRDGIVWGITDSYRTYKVQNKIFDWDYYKQTGKSRKKGTSGTVAAAYPGTSNHGFGSAVDLNLYGAGVYGSDRKTKEAKDNYKKCQEWLRQNASKYGFFELVAANEPWHWDHKESAAAFKRDLGSSQEQLGSKQDQILKLKRKVNRFIQGDLVATPSSKSANDFFAFINFKLKSLGYTNSDLWKNIKAFQKNKKLPDIHPTIQKSQYYDIITHNMLFNK